MPWRDPPEFVRQPGESAPYYRSLRRNMLLTIIAVAFIPVFLVSSLIFLELQNAYQEKVQDQMRDLVEKHRQQIDAFLHERLSDIRYLALNLPHDPRLCEAFLQEQLLALQQAFGPVFVDLGLVDGEGRQLAYAGPYPLRRAEYAEAPWFLAARRQSITVSDVFLGLRGLPHFIVAAQHAADGREWILRATIDFKAFNSLVESIRVGRTGHAFIINQEGELQTTAGGLEEQPPDHYKVLLTAFLTESRRPAMGERVQVVRRSDAQGRTVLCAGAFLKEGQWLMIYQQLASEAFSHLTRIQRISALIFLAGGLLIVSMAWFLARRMVGHIALSNREKEMMNQQVIETGKLASIGELAAGIAHEINNPVAIMVEEAGWIQDLLQEEDLKGSANLEEFQRALKQIRTQGGRCKEITHKLLSFARKTDSRVQEVQINVLVEELVALTEQRAKYALVEIQTRLESPLPLVRVSPSELQQVFLNLINNALDAMSRKGGILTLATRREEGQVVVDVSDTGQGIPPANLPRIFDPFFTTKPVGKGTGLGLSICYGIVSKLGGQIDVQSALEAGTTFRVRLPALESEAA
jgi:two-component system NtrC family sensor kinase